MNEALSKYLHSQSRNKIVFLKKPLSRLDSLNVGFEVAKELKPILSDSKVGLKSLLIIDDIFSKSILESNVYRKYLAISNLGILFEQDLKVDFVNLLDKYSTNNILFVYWEGEIEDGILYFLTKEKGQKIDIKNLSHIVI